MEKNIINQVMTFSEAEELYSLKKCYLRKKIFQINAGKEKRTLIEGIDYRKSGSTWLITKEALDREFKGDD